MIALLLLLLTGCGALPTAAPAGQAPAVTWARNIGPLLERRCATCHTDGGLGVFPLDDYATAAALGPSLVDAVEGGRMPPFLAQSTADCPSDRPWKDDPRLSGEERALLRDWVDQGAPLGDPVAAPIADDTAAPSIGAGSRYTFAAPFEVPSGPDLLECFVLDPGQAADAYITEIEFLPDNRAIDHHALVFADLHGASAALATDGHFPCFNTIRTNGYLMASWAPGGTPIVFPAEASLWLPRSALIVVQMHYHPIPGQTVTDQSALRIVYADAPTDYAAPMLLLGNADHYEPATGTGLLPSADEDGEASFRVPAGATDHVEQMVYDLEQEESIPIWAVGPHMHLAGASQRIDRLPAEGGADCLLSVPRYDYGWQRGFAYDVGLGALPTIAPGDRLSLRCTYDNSLENPAIARALAEQGLDAPVDLYLGEETLDEMCIGAFGLILPMDAFVERMSP